MVDPREGIDIGQLKDRPHFEGAGLAAVHVLIVTITYSLIVLDH